MAGRLRKAGSPWHCRSVHPNNPANIIHDRSPRIDVSAKLMFGKVQSSVVVSAPGTAAAVRCCHQAFASGACRRRHRRPHLVVVLCLSPTVTAPQRQLAPLEHAALPVNRMRVALDERSRNHPPVPPAIRHCDKLACGAGLLKPHVRLAATVPRLYPREFRDDVVRVARNRDDGGDDRADRLRFWCSSDDVVEVDASSRCG